MINGLIFVFLLFGLTIAFKKAADWFRINKGINIVPAALIDTVAEMLFIFNYGTEQTKNNIWLGIAIAIVLAIVVFNLMNYGFKDGILTSLAEMIFSISAAFLIACILVAESQKNAQKQKKRKRK